MEVLSHMRRHFITQIVLGFFFFHSELVLVSFLSDFFWASIIVLTIERHILNYLFKECKFYTVVSLFYI